MSIRDELTTLFEAVGRQHHDAFAETDGEDPDWAAWYADRLKPRFDELLDVSLTKCEVVSLLLSLEQEHAALGEGKPWASFYAHAVAQRFHGAAEETLSLYYYPSCGFCRMVLSGLDVRAPAWARVWSGGQAPDHKAKP